MDGLLNVYKERGFTSHDVVAKLRGILKQKKIGHTGTLDPEAEGVLPVCVGKATKACGLITDSDKVYRTVLLLGTETDTQDIWGQILRERAVDAREDQVREAVAGFIGTYHQIPPMYSALKVNGKKLYELARQGKTVERRPRTVEIYGIRVEAVDLPRITMTVSCSKGTYIRTLCHDIGTVLGCGGCMERLVRVQAAGFSVENALTLDQIEACRDEGRLEDVLLPVDVLFSRYPAFMPREEAEHLLKNGNPLEISRIIRMGEEDSLTVPEFMRMYDRDGHFAGLYEYDRDSGRCLPKKMFFV